MAQIRTCKGSSRAEKLWVSTAGLLNVSYQDIRKDWLESALETMFNDGKRERTRGGSRHVQHSQAAAFVVQKGPPLGVFLAARGLVNVMSKLQGEVLREGITSGCPRSLALCSLATEVMCADSVMACLFVLLF